MDWSDFISGLGQAGASIATAVIGPRTPQAIPGAPGAVYIPNAASGQIVQSGGALGALGIAGGGSALLILLAVVLIFALRK